MAYCHTDPLHSLGRNWYHANADAKTAKHMLMERGKEGSFLVRPSRGGKLTLSVRWGRSVHHIKLSVASEGAGGGVRLVADAADEFATVSDLLLYYHDVPLRVGGTSVLLLYPLNTYDASNERWYHGILPLDKMYYLMHRYGKQGSFLVRQDPNEPDVFAVTVRTNKRTEQVAELHHIKVSKIEEGQYEIEGMDQRRQYTSLTEVVHTWVGYHTTEGIPILLKWPIFTTVFCASFIARRITNLDKMVENVKGEMQTAFEQEFLSMQMDPPKVHVTFKAANEADNKPLNRYKNILPNDQCRVILQDGMSPTYINASYVKAEMIDSDLDNATTIATQGCLAHTAAHFWRMVLQENTRVIAMTTKICENGKNKCTKYYPEEQDGEKLFEAPAPGNGVAVIRVRFISQTTNPKCTYCCRVFEVDMSGAGVKEYYPRRVYQYHFLAWPDYGVPKDPGVVLEYMRDLKIKQATLHKEKGGIGPHIIHCSAGIGRTGCVIALDVLISQCRKKGFDCALDVFEVVRLLRAQRPGVVQTAAQYRFIYVALEHYIGTMIQRTRALQKKERQQQQRQQRPPREGNYENIYNNAPEGS